MDTFVYYSVWIWAITTAGIPIFNFGRAYFSLSPVFVHLTIKEKLVWYKGLNRERAGIIVFYSLLSLAFAFIFGKKIILQNSLFDFYLMLFINVLIQLWLTIIIESKMPFGIKESIKNLFDKNFSYYQKIELNIKTKKEKFREKVINDINELKEALDYLIFITVNIKEQLNLNFLPYELKKEVDKNFNFIKNEYGISEKSKADIIDLLNGKFPKNKIIFRYTYSGKINKKIIFEFFKNHFIIIDDENADWVSPQKQILDFINSLITFETDDKNYKELNEISLIMDDSTLSRYKNF